MRARRAAFRALVALEKGRTSRIELAGPERIAAADRSLAIELARGAERMRILLDRVLEEMTARGLPRDPYLRVALRLGAYQILLLERVPAHAAVSETVALVRRGRGFVNAVLRRLAERVVARPPEPRSARREIPLPGGRALVLETDLLPDPEEEPAGFLALRHALPAFLVDRWVRAFGRERAAAIAAASTRAPGVILRPRAGLDAAELRGRLAEEGIETEPAEHPRMLRWTGGGSAPAASRAFAEGLFVVQDPTALRAAEAVGARPGERIVDLCAAPGGKATALAEAVAPGGRVWAFDIDPRRRRRLLENAARLGLGETLVVLEDLDAAPRDPDAVLVDAPCSNTGVLARRVEVRRRLQPETFAEMARVQRALLEDALERVREGGRVVYATCSLEPEEDEHVVRACLAAASRGTIEEEQRAWPDPPRRDGGYHARLRV